MLSQIKKNWHYWLFRNHAVSYASSNLTVCECGKQWVR